MPGKMENTEGSQFPKSGKRLQQTLFIDIVLLSYFFTFIEWSFYVTDISISFMYSFTIWKKIEIFLVAGLVISIFCLLLQYVFILLDFILTKKFQKKQGFISYIPKAILFSIIGLIVVDNFTYTVFTFGLSTIGKVGTVLYLVLFLAAISGFVRFFTIVHKQASAAYIRFKKISALGLIGAAILSGAVSFVLSPGSNKGVDAVVSGKEAGSYPNIIIMETDGMDADRMSAYGYSKETTPFISELAKKSLFSENNFSNASKSLGSDISMLTGKSPFDTRVIYNPDTLIGDDIKEHLPGILKSLGYETIDMSVPYYMDTNTTNLQGGFDVSNFADQSQIRYKVNQFFSFRFTNEEYLISSLINAVEERINKLFFIKNMVNPYSYIINFSEFGPSDHVKITSLDSALQQAKSMNKPLFAHLHLMITHGNLFYTQNHVFSQGLTQDNLSMDEFYADAILDYDGYVKALVDYLQKIDEYNNTIIVISTDHGQGWVTDERLPMIIHFPKDEHAGVITENTQNLDLAPTLLDYLGVEEPTWMSGKSLLSPISKKRLIISGDTDQMAVMEGFWALYATRIKPPFYQFSSITAVQCQNIYEINLKDLTLSQSVVDNYVDPCPESELDSSPEIRAQLGEFLQKNGFVLPDNW